MSALNGILLVSIFNSAKILAVCQLRVRDNKYIAVHVARALGTPLDFELDPSLVFARRVPLPCMASTLILGVEHSHNQVLGLNFFFF